MKLHIYIYSPKAKSQAGNMSQKNVNLKCQYHKGNQLGILHIYAFC